MLNPNFELITAEPDYWLQCLGHHTLTNRNCSDHHNERTRKISTTIKAAPGEVFIPLLPIEFLKATVCEITCRTYFVVAAAGFFTFTV